MKLFISWSGDQSKAIAIALASWIKGAIQAVEPWISTEAGKGTRWGAEVQAALLESKMGLVCITKDNMEAPWLLFEAGAISNTKDALVFTFLVGVKPTDVTQPLSQFNHTSFDRDELLKLFKDINDQLKKCGEKGLDDETLRRTFELHWPILEKDIVAAEAMAPAEEHKSRPPEEMMEEALELLRGLDRRAREAEQMEARDNQRRALIAALNDRIAGRSDSLGLVSSNLARVAMQYDFGKGLLDLGRLANGPDDKAAPQEGAKPDSPPPASEYLSPR